MTDPAELVREACDLLAGYLPRLAELTPEPDDAAWAAPGLSGRPPAAPLPGNAQAIYAKTGIEASALHIEGVLKYAAGARRPGLLAVRGWSDVNILGALDAIPALIGAADDDLYRIIIGELEARLDDARKVRAIDEAQQWRYLRGRQCRYCGCHASLRVLLDAAGRPTDHIECFGHDEYRVPCRAVVVMDTDERGRPGLRWPDGVFEAAPDLEDGG